MDTDVLGALQKAAQAGVKLSQLAPQLAQISENIRTTSVKQADMEKSFSVGIEDMTQKVDETVTQLTDSSTGIGDIVSLIRSISLQTKMLSINASIEAARAGEFGKAFSVVAHSIQDLSSETRKATDRVSSSLDEISSGIHDTRTIIGLENDDTANNTFTFHAINKTIAQFAEIADQQSQTSILLNNVAQEIRNYSENLLLTLGECRFQAHEEAEQIFKNIIDHPDFNPVDYHASEQFLSDQITHHNLFELFYVTDTSGVQITSNILANNLDQSAKGKNWSDRPWFTGVQANNAVYISDIYRSVATDSFCFTVSARVTDRNGNWIAVLAADVNFEKLVD